MSNSKLVVYKKLSPHCNKPRNHKIDKIVIHHMAGNLTIEACGQVFQTRQASSNYGIGTDGRIGMYVEEKNRSWATSNAAVDNRAVTIEVANSKSGGNWPVSDKAMKSLINLCVDICKRNGIKKLKYTGGKNGNLLMHCWYASTACPGPYLKSKFSYIAKEVNKKLGASGSTKNTTTTPSTSTKKTSDSYLVDVTASALNIRRGAGTKHAVVGVIRDKGRYTIVETSGDWGKLKSGAGWICLDYTKKVSSSSAKKKSTTEIAKEVLAGKWGNGEERRQKLEKAGYDYDTIQDKVNELS